MRNVITAVIVGSALLSACVTAPGPGMKQGAIAPKLSMEGGMKVWSNVESFGPVPAAQAALGAETCGRMNSMDKKYIATGYHAQAQGLDGKTLPGGGFFCVQK